MSNLSCDKWNAFYRNNYNPDKGRYPSEWIVRTLAGGSYPTLNMDKNLYKGAKILDLGCGDGRNLPLLLNLGFEVEATEITKYIVCNLEILAHQLLWPVKFSVGLNTNLPFPNEYFDYMLCSSSCYYMSSDITWPQIRQELCRVIKPGGLLIANFPDEKNAVLNGAIRHNDGSFEITNDPSNLRNEIRFFAVNSPEELMNAMTPQFDIISTGYQNDNYYGLMVSGYIFVAKRI